MAEGEVEGEAFCCCEKLLENEFYLEDSSFFFFFCSFKNYCTVALVLMLHRLIVFYLGLMWQSHSYGYEWSFEKVHTLE